MASLKNVGYFCVFDVFIVNKRFNSMGVGIIRLTEQELKDIVLESVDEVLRCRSWCGETLPLQMVDEALLYSYDTSVVLRHLCGTFDLANGYREYSRNPSSFNGFVSKRKNKNNCSVILLALPIDSLQLLKEITLSMERSCGWFLATKGEIEIQGFESWQFEKKKDDDATHEVLDKPFIFHLCPTSRLQKILHVGLLPKKTTWESYMLDDAHTFSDRHGQHYGWKTVDRVYAFLDKPDASFIRNNAFKEKNILTDSYTLLQIDTTKLLQDTKFSFDPRSEGSVFTLSNIPPLSLSVVK